MVRGRIANPKHASSQFDSDTHLQYRRSVKLAGANNGLQNRPPGVRFLTPLPIHGDTARCGLGSHKPEEMVRVHLAPPKIFYDNVHFSIYIHLESVYSNNVRNERNRP